MSGLIARRTVLAGAVALPSLVACSRGKDSSPALDLDEGTLRSRFWPGQEVHWRLARPGRPAATAAAPRNDARRQPLVVALHGLGGDASWPFDSVHIERHVVPTGLAVVTVDGGDFYWHARRSGIDTGRMVTDELLPVMARNGLTTDRVGLIGWSMGGYGALLMATRLGPSRVAGVVAASAALWQSPGDSASGAFDDRADFVRNDVFAARGRLHGIPLRVDCGRDDPFIAANRAFTRQLPAAAVLFDEGTHTEEYWTAHAGDEMKWLRNRFR